MGFLPERNSGFELVTGWKIIWTGGGFLSCENMFTTQVFTTETPDAHELTSR